MKNETRFAALTAAHRGLSEKRSVFEQSLQVHKRAQELLAARQRTVDQLAMKIDNEAAAKAATLAAALARGEAVANLPTAPDAKLARSMAEARDALGTTAAASTSVNETHRRAFDELKQAEAAVADIVNRIVADEVAALAARIEARQAQTVQLRERLLALEQAMPAARQAILRSHSALAALGPPAPGTTSPWGVMINEQGPHQERIATAAEEWRAHYAALIAGDGSEDIAVKRAA